LGIIVGNGVCSGKQKNETNTISMIK